MTLECVPILYSSNVAGKGMRYSLTNMLPRHYLDGRRKRKEGVGGFRGKLPAELA